MFVSMLSGIPHFEREDGGRVETNNFDTSFIIHGLDSNWRDFRISVPNEF